MRWMRTAVGLCLGIVAAAVFLGASRRAALGRTVSYTCGSGGDLYLLSDEPALSKAAEGLLEWSVSLPVQGEDGASLRYGLMAADRSGGVYVVRQDYQQRVNAWGEREEAVLRASVLAFHSDGTERDPVLTADLTGLSWYGAGPYILSLRAYGDSLLAVCHNQGQYETIRIEPYGEQPPEVVSTLPLELDPEDIQDCTALSDGSLVYSTTGGGLFLASAGGELRDLRPLAGETALIGRLSADEADQVYYTELQSGALCRMDLTEGAVSRVFSSYTVVEEEAGTTFDQLRGARALGDGMFCAASIDGEDPFWLCFDRDGGSFRYASARRGWDGAAAGAAGVLAAAAAVWLLACLGGQSRLTRRILSRFLPVLLLVLAAVGGALGSRAMARAEEGWTLGLAAAARTAARLTPAGQLAGAVPGRYGPAEREDFLQMAAEAEEEAAEVSGLQDVGIVFYALEGDRLLCVYAALERDRFCGADYLVPLDRELPAGTVEQISARVQEGGSVAFCRDKVAYLSWFQPVRDSRDRVVGLVEARAERPGAVRAEAAAPVCWLLGAAALIALWLLLVVARAFRPLRELSRCIAAISAGSWGVKARTDSRDELAEIGIGFNQMTEKLGQYISSMVLLNNEYIKFTPRELFQLMGKAKVTDLRLGSRSVRKAGLLCIGFRLKEGKLDSEGFFTRMNEGFDQIFQVVDRNHGAIQRFDGSGAIALFPEQVRDALNTAAVLEEAMARRAGAVELTMLVSWEEVLVGVAGNGKRQAITALSPAILDLHALTGLMEELGVRHALTRQTVEEVSGDVYFNCREVGSGLSGRDTLYELLDGMDPYEKKLRLVTRGEFERGVHDFQAGRYGQARKRFAAVLQINGGDRTAMYYLLRCGGAGEAADVEH